MKCLNISNVCAIAVLSTTLLAIGCITPAGIKAPWSAASARIPAEPTADNQSATDSASYAVYQQADGEPGPSYVSGAGYVMPGSHTPSRGSHSGNC